ncbi:MAG: hypothetical protein WC023_06525 [Rhodocyclaceae bacterium]
MNDRFIIVIETDHKRALAAYTKGLADLDLFMPQLLEACKAKDEAAIKRYEEQCAARDAASKKEDEEHEEFIRQHEALRAWLADSWPRGPRPPEPKWPTYRSGLVQRPSAPTLRRDVFQSIRAELVRMRDIAGAAIGPFRMTEGQVTRMVAWENGSRIERLRESAGADAVNFGDCHLWIAP